MDSSSSSSNIEGQSSGVDLLRNALSSVDGIKNLQFMPEHVKASPEGQRFLTDIQALLKSNNDKKERQKEGRLAYVPNQTLTLSEIATPPYPPPNANMTPSAAQSTSAWAGTRPTLTGGTAAGRVSGTPIHATRTDELGSLALDDHRTRRKNTPADQSMRRSIQDLVASVDPNVKIETEVEDLLLSIADEFIDSVTNFACRLAKHRGGDTLEVRDLQLHLERNHNIRIPGFASDETRISLSQSSVAPAPTAPQKKAAQGTHMTLRSQRLAQVQQAKREAKLM